MDTIGLRELLGPHIIGLSNHYTHKTLPNLCERLGLPPIVPEGSKSERLEATFALVPDGDLPRLLDRFIEVQALEPQVRNSLQDWLWQRQPFLEIPKKARRDVARTINIEDLFINTDRFDTLLENLWVLRDGISFFIGKSLKDSIEQHVYRNRGDWSTEELFDKLGAFDATHRRFALFLEGIVSPHVLPDEPAQRRFVDTANQCLENHGIELRECGLDGGYPIFRLVSTRNPANRTPKNLIFASDVKPDLRFRDAVDNDVEIVTNADRVLIYDRTIGTDGLRWRDLQQWWADQQKISDEQKAKETLYRRLLDCLPTTSPPQRFLFECYHRTFGKAVPHLPALLPEVWLHWDPKTVKERGPDALLRFRMDFLMLLPHGVRVVVEVDGKQHYANSSGMADTALYAQMVKADRDLKLSGYEVFRFGGAELQSGADASKMVKDFFYALFKLFRVPLPSV